MDPKTHAIIARCHEGSETGSMDFPTIVGTLLDAGVEGYAVDFRRSTKTYYLPDGESVELLAMPIENPVAPSFDAEKVAAAVWEAQAKVAGYSYAGFCAKVTAAGCAGYLVSFPGRRVVYYGRTAETHVEHFPKAT